MKKIFFILITVLSISSCNDLESDILTRNDETEVRTLGPIVTDSLFANEYELNSLIAEFKDSRETKADNRSEVNYKISHLSRNGNNLIHIVNFDNEGGFLILSGTKNYLPVLAYADDCNFDLQKGIPPMAEVWLEEMVDYLSNQMTMPKDSVGKYQRLWKRYEYKPLYEQQERFSRSNERFDPYELHEVVKDSTMKWSANRDYEVIPLYGTLTGDEEYDASIWEESKDAIWPEYFDYWDWLTVGLKYEVQSAASNLDYEPIKTAWHGNAPYNQSFPMMLDTCKNYFKPHVGFAAIAAGQILYHYKYPTKFNWKEMEDPVKGDKAIADFLYQLSEDFKSHYSPDRTYASFSDVKKVLRSYGFNVTDVKDLSHAHHYPVLVSSELEHSDGQGVEWVISNKYEFYSISRVGIWTFTDPHLFQEWWATFDDIYGCGYSINWGLGRKNQYYAIPVPPLDGNPEFNLKMKEAICISPQ